MPREATWQTGARAEQVQEPGATKSSAGPAGPVGGDLRLGLAYGMRTGEPAAPRTAAPRPDVTFTAAEQRDHDNFKQGVVNL
jgi:hypothetical protein